MSLKLKGWGIWHHTSGNQIKILIFFNENKQHSFVTNSCFLFTGTALIFTEPPTNVSVRIGQTISVHASVLNAKYVRWFKGRDHVISISTSFQEEFQSPKASLTLTNARPQDDGEYTCVAETFGRNKQEIRQTFSIFVLRGTNVTLFSLYTPSNFNYMYLIMNNLCQIILYGGILLPPTCKM